MHTRMSGRHALFAANSLIVVLVVAALAVADDMVQVKRKRTARNKRALTKQYSAFPYPSRTREDTPGTNSVSFPTVSYLAFGGRYASVWRRPDLRILDAGGGTGDATLTVATQLLSIGNEAARVVQIAAEIAANWRVAHRRRAQRRWR